MLDRSPLPKVASLASVLLLLYVSTQVDEPTFDKVCWRMRARPFVFLRLPHVQAHVRLIAASSPLPLPSTGSSLQISRPSPVAFERFQSLPTLPSSKAKGGRRQELPVSAPCYQSCCGRYSRPHANNAARSTQKRQARDWHGVLFSCLAAWQSFSSVCLRGSLSRRAHVRKSTTTATGGLQVGRQVAAKSSESPAMSGCVPAMDTW